MHHLAPAPAVPRAAQPAPPERHGGVELRGNVGTGVWHRHLAGLDAVEYEGGGLSGPEGDARADVAAFDDLERAAGREAEPQLGSAEQSTVRGQRDLVARAPVVEARGYVDNEVHLPTDCEDLANHAVVVHRLAGMRWGHEVLHLPTPSGVKKRVMRIGVWDVKLLERQPSQSGEMRNRPPWSASRMAAKTLGESNRGQQYQSIVPSVPTSATVCRSPIRPCSAIGR
jgi:hypothetical protein